MDRVGLSEEEVDESVQGEGNKSITLGGRYTLQQIASFQQQDTKLGSVIGQLKGKPVDPKVEKPLETICRTNRLKNELLFHKFKDGSLVLEAPKILQSEIVSYFHEETETKHRCNEDTLGQVRKVFYWTGQVKAVEKYVQKCERCQGVITESVEKDIEVSSSEEEHDDDTDELEKQCEKSEGIRKSKSDSNLDISDKMKKFLQSLIGDLGQNLAQQNQKLSQDISNIDQKIEELNQRFDLYETAMIQGFENVKGQLDQHEKVIENLKIEQAKVNGRIDAVQDKVSQEMKELRKSFQGITISAEQIQTNLEIKLTEKTTDEMSKVKENLKQQFNKLSEKLTKISLESSELTEPEETEVRPKIMQPSSIGTAPSTSTGEFMSVNMTVDHTKLIELIQNRTKKSPPAYLKKVEQNFQVFGIPEGKWISLLQTFSDDTVKTWMENAGISNWDKFKVKYLEHFFTNTEEKAYRKKFKERYRFRFKSSNIILSEVIWNYLSDLNEMGFKHSVEDEVRKCIKLLPSYIRTHLILQSEIKTFEQLMTKIKNFEEVYPITNKEFHDRGNYRPPAKRFQQVNQVGVQWNSQQNKNQNNGQGNNSCQQQNTGQGRNNWTNGNGKRSSNSPPRQNFYSKQSNYNQQQRYSPQNQGYNRGYQPRQGQSQNYQTNAWTGNDGQPTMIYQNGPPFLQYWPYQDLQSSLYPRCWINYPQVGNFPGSMTQTVQHGNRDNRGMTENASQNNSSGSVQTQPKMRLDTESPDPYPIKSPQRN